MSDDEKSSLLDSPTPYKNSQKLISFGDGSDQEKDEHLSILKGKSGRNRPQSSVTFSKRRSSSFSSSPAIDIGKSMGSYANSFGSYANSFGSYAGAFSGLFDGSHNYSARFKSGKSEKRDSQFADAPSQPQETLDRTEILAKYCALFAVVYFRHLAEHDPTNLSATLQPYTFSSKLPGSSISLLITKDSSVSDLISAALSSLPTALAGLSDSNVEDIRHFSISFPAPDSDAPDKVWTLHVGLRKRRNREPKLGFQYPGTHSAIRKYVPWHVRKVAEQYRVTPSIRVSQIQFLADEEIKMLKEYSESPIAMEEDPPSAPKILHKFFEVSAEKYPTNPALCWEQKEYSYEWMNKKAENIALKLRKKGVEHGGFVGLYMAKSVELYVSMIAVLKLGAAYVPLDLSFPPDRVKFILGDCGAKVLMVNTPLPEDLQTWDGNAVQMKELMEEPDETEEFVAPQINRESYAYVIYTSGTTGLPKGVLITHSNIVYLVRSERILFETRMTDRVAQGFSVAFDASLEELWMAWAAGGTLVPVPEDTMKQPDVLPSFLVNNKVNVFSTVPTLLSLLEHFSTLRLLILGGEVCPAELLTKWYSPKNRVINSYGPTETTVVSTAADYIPGVKLTIGRAIPGYKVFVLDQTGQLVPFGGAGELCIGGGAVAAGYLNREELTNAKFNTIVKPLATGFTGRIYRTGDLVRLSELGTIEFLGRIDTQVKIRGYRVELAEIESLLLQCKGVRNSAVAVKEKGEVKKLVAYLVLDEGKTEINEEEIKGFLREKLAPYMVPSHYVVMNAFPLLTSGKVDRKLLPDPVATNSSSSAREITPPEGPIETLIHEAWSKILGISDLCTKDDFFMSGGNSLLASLAVSQLRQLPPFRGISVKDIYKLRTVKALSQTIEEAAQPKANYDSASDSEVKMSSNGNVNGSGELRSYPKKKKTIKQAPLVNPVVRFITSLLQISTLAFFWFAGVAIIHLGLYWRIDLGDDWYFYVACGFMGFNILYIPLTCLLGILAKWILIGRFKEGEYKLWGFYYYRFWLVKTLMGFVPMGTLSATPFLGYYMRLLGANVGKNVFVGTTRVFCFDLIDLSDGASVAREACLLGYRVESGRLIISGKIKVGKNSYVGLRSVLEGGTTIGDNSEVGDLSSVLTGSRIPSGESWTGSPAQFVSKLEEVECDWSPAPGYHVLQWIAMGFISFYPFIGGSAWMVGVIVTLWSLNLKLDGMLGTWLTLPLLFPLSALYVLVSMTLIIILKRVIIGKPKGAVRLYSLGYVRHWLADEALSMSLDNLRSVYATMFAASWMRWMGAKIGEGSEVSTLNHISSDHLQVGKNAFLADSVSIGAPRVQYGWVTINPTVIGDKTFIGNSAVIAGGTVLGKDSLIGALSTAPPQTPADGTNWVGSPPFLIPNRAAIEVSFDAKLTFSPPWYLVLYRAITEFFKIVLPFTFATYTAAPWSYFCVWQLDVMQWPWWRCYLQACGALFAVLGFFTLFTIALKWILVGKYYQTAKPLWSPYVWRSELINSLCESYVFPAVVEPLLGTPYATWFFSMMGSHFGRFVYMDTTEITEFDLVWVGDYVALNNEVTLQTHLFEDRIMKMSTLKIGRNATIGTSSVVLYDSSIGPNVALKSLSLLMKGETLPGDTVWAGVPSAFLHEN
eukprot:TRINITY_DN2179_c0_g2_i1.p1 TRINITY_DN2179_c0_g2~~TRINITY_DN2179_c0_g2_i1.p1  ORF type:complete len:1647 (-),score=690.33 TRINITY_DN2179_c0_g2_i1:50-4990(-)